MLTEEWKDLRYPGYQISSHGRLRGRRGKILKLRPKSDSGYLMAYFAWQQDGIRHQDFRPVHTLVCEAFYGPRPSGKQAAHRNCDKTDNSAANLYWATPQENADDCRRNGCLQVSFPELLRRARERYAKRQNSPKV